MKGRAFDYIISIYKHLWMGGGGRAAELRRGWTTRSSSRGRRGGAASRPGPGSWAGTHPGAPSPPVSPSELQAQNILSKAGHASCPSSPPLPRVPRDTSLASLCSGSREDPKRQDRPHLPGAPLHSTHPRPSGFLGEGTCPGLAGRQHPACWGGAGLQDTLLYLQGRHVPVPGLRSPCGSWGWGAEGPGLSRTSGTVRGPAGGRQGPGVHIEERKSRQRPLVLTCACGFKTLDRVGETPLKFGSRMTPAPSYGPGTKKDLVSEQRARSTSAHCHFVQNSRPSISQLSIGRARVLPLPRGIRLRGPTAPQKEPVLPPRATCILRGTALDPCHQGQGWKGPRGGPREGQQGEE